MLITMRRSASGWTFKRSMLAQAGSGPPCGRTAGFGDERVVLLGEVNIPLRMLLKS